MSTIPEKLIELRSAIQECERHFFNPENRRELSDLGPKFWHALSMVIISAVPAESPDEDAEEITKAIGTFHRQLGAPGDFGYGTPCGDALRGLYDRHREMCRLLIAKKDAEAMAQ